MQLWFKENWLKVGILLTFIATGLAIGYYFISFLPSETREESRHALMLECKELGEKIEAEKHPHEKELNESYVVPSAQTINPEYHFNAKLKQCFYSGGDFVYGNRGPNDVLITKHIINAYTNQEVITSVCNNMEKQCVVGNENIFDKVKHDLFEEN